jgi:hypothetical protein
VFEKRVLRKIFWPKELTGNWRKLHSEQLLELYSSPNIIQVSNVAPRVVRRGKRKVHIGFGWENLKERDHWKDISINGRILLKMP